jgi:hypothetical protein
MGKRNFQNDIEIKRRFCIDFYLDFEMKKKGFQAQHLKLVKKFKMAIYDDIFEMKWRILIDSAIFFS